MKLDIGMMDLKANEIIKITKVFLMKAFRKLINDVNYKRILRARNNDIININKK